MFYFFPTLRADVEHQFPALFITLLEFLLNGAELALNSENSGSLMVAGPWNVYMVQFWMRPPLRFQNLSFSRTLWENLAKSYVGAPPLGMLEPPQLRGILYLPLLKHEWGLI